MILRFIYLCFLQTKTKVLQWFHLINIWEKASLFPFKYLDLNNLRHNKIQFKMHTD